jgi:hypothetical protein
MGCAHVNTIEENYEHVCTDCGVVLDTYYACSGLNPSFFQRKATYKRRHHWIAAIMTYQNADTKLVTDEVFNLFEREYRKKFDRKIVTKSRTRSIQKVAKWKYHDFDSKIVDKWVHLRHRMMATKHRPLRPVTLRFMLDVFRQFELAFIHCPDKQGRYSMITYNILITACLIKCGQPECLPFFPPVKSKPNADRVLIIWRQMESYLGWTPIVFPDKKIYRNYW